MKARNWKWSGYTLARRLLPLDSSTLCREAMHHTGLEDFGSPALEPALSILLQSLDEEAELHTLGRGLIRIHLLDLLKTRLRLVAFWKAQAENSEVARIEKPVFIVGMPRSGSTFLHELLAESPEHRAPRVWEVMYPVALGRETPSDPGRRIRKTALCLWWFRRLAPRADAVYPMRAMTPHECVAIHSYTFLSEEFIATCRIPAYEAFLRRTDLTPAYTFQKRFLQHLQLDRPGQRWVLKSPDHVHGLEELFAIFPDAVIVQTHRNPLEVIKSSADLTQVLRGLYGPSGDPEEIRAREARLLGEGTERFLQFRDSHPELSDRFIDVRYTDLISSPAATVEQICENIKSPLTEQARERIRQLALSRSRYGGHRASEERTKLRLATAADTRRFERYCSRYGLPFQEAGLHQ